MIMCKYSDFMVTKSTVGVLFYKNWKIFVSILVNKRGRYRIAITPPLFRE